MANALEHLLDYPLGATLPARGRALEVAPGVRWLRMGLPFALDHINLWLLRDRDAADGREGWTVVDCGIDDDATRAAWEDAFAHALDGLPVLRVLATHMHPDHVGLAHWLTERWSRPEQGQACRLWMSAGDWGAAQVAHQGLGGAGDGGAGFYARHGLRDPAVLQALRGRTRHYPSLVGALPGRYRRLLDGQRLAIGGAPWRCIAGYGHAPEHISLFREEDAVLISGDMVLPRISTNVSVWDVEPEADPLPLFLGSLDALRALPAHTLVLPSHGRPFRGLHERIGQLHAHHEERLAALAEACRGAALSAHDALPVLFHRALNLHESTFAMGEAVAHLHALAGRGLLRALPLDAEGVQRFAAA